MSRKTKSPKPVSKPARLDINKPHAAAVTYRALEPRTVFDAAMVATEVEVAHEQSAAERASLAQFHADTAIEAVNALAVALRDAPARPRMSPPSFLLIRPSMTHKVCLKIYPPHRT